VAATVPGITSHRRAGDDADVRRITLTNASAEQHRIIMTMHRSNGAGHKEPSAGAYAARRRGVRLRVPLNASRRSSTASYTHRQGSPTSQRPPLEQHGGHGADLLVLEDVAGHLQQSVLNGVGRQNDVVTIAASPRLRRGPARAGSRRVSPASARRGARGSWPPDSILTRLVVVMRAAHVCASAAVARPRSKRTGDSRQLRNVAAHQ